MNVDFGLANLIDDSLGTQTCELVATPFHISAGKLTGQGGAYEADAEDMLRHVKDYAWLDFPQCDPAK
jgi:hypothetical protein